MVCVVMRRDPASTFPSLSNRNVAGCLLGAERRASVRRAPSHGAHFPILEVLHLRLREGNPSPKVTQESGSPQGVEPLAALPPRAGGFTTLRAPPQGGAGQSPSCSPPPRGGPGGGRRK